MNIEHLKKLRPDILLEDEGNKTWSHQVLRNGPQVKGKYPVYNRHVIHFLPPGGHKSINATNAIHVFRKAQSSELQPELSRPFFPGDNLPPVLVGCPLHGSKTRGIQIFPVCFTHK